MSKFESTKITIIDYGMGNLQSVRMAFKYIGCDVDVSSNPSSLQGADALILPGVGAFGEAMHNLKQRNLITPLRQAVLEEEKPLLGICLGMQLLADSSEERGTYSGLSFIPGQVKEIPVCTGYRLPHIGWNSVSVCQSAPILRDIHDEEAFYFVHSYRFECDTKYIVGITDYGAEIAAAVQKDHIFGVQFHPERSHRKGLRLLGNFVEFVKSSGNKTC